jgi:Oxygen-sensitive ribonucleoside-triphosphate reductase
MSNQNNLFENASQRISYVGEIYNEGASAIKNQILNSLPNAWAELHTSGSIHIHDLESYGLTYNCLTPDFLRTFPYHTFSFFSSHKKIMEIFEYLKKIIVKLGNEQSGGIGFANFDEDLSTII